jgi:hypothetical protein
MKKRQSESVWRFFCPRQKPPLTILRFPAATDNGHYDPLLANATL